MQKPAAQNEGPRVRATVVEIKTTIAPSNRTSTHTIIIGTDSARSMADGLRWNLYQWKQNRVIHVDEIARTYDAEPLQSLIARRRIELASDIEDVKLPHAEYSVTNESKDILGVPARQSVVKMGQYVRQIWIGVHPQIPAQLFSMMHAAEEPSAFAPLARNAEDALMTVQGFPLAEHAEVPYGNKKMVIDRAVTAIRQEDVPASTFEIPAGYKQVQPPPMPKPEPPRVKKVEEVAPAPLPPPKPPPVATQTTTTPAEPPKVVEKPKAPAKKPAVTKPADKKKIAPKAAAKPAAKPAVKPAPKPAPKKKTTKPAARRPRAS